MQLLSNDNSCVWVHETSIAHSQLLCEFRDSYPGDDVPLPNVDTPTLLHIAEILNHIPSTPVTLTKPVSANLPQELGPLYQHIPDDMQALHRCWAAADYIMSDPISNLVCAKLAYLTMHMTPPDIRAAIRVRDCDILPFIPDLNEKPELKRLCNSVQRLQWAVNNGYEYNTPEVCNIAAENGNLDVLKCAHEHGCPWNAKTCVSAVAGGHLDVLKWAREHGCHWNAKTCVSAAKGGHLDVLKYARENGCPWDKWTCSGAALGGHVDVLKYAREHGCPWDENTCSAATENGHLHVLQYAREHGCPE